MIKEIFLPEKTKSRRFISQRIIGISIQENTVSAAQVYATPSATMVEKLHEEAISPGAPDRYSDRVAEAIKKIISNFSRYDQMRIAVSSTIVTFKELTLPFVDNEKLKMVVEYEVEPQLPFSINDAIVDFVVTKQEIEKKSSQVLVAAARKKDLQKIIDVFVLADIDPDCITVDLFALYGLYLQIPQYKNVSGTSAIIDIGLTATNLAFLLDGQVRLIRNLSKGLHTIAKHISDDTKIEFDVTIQNLINFGMQKPNDPTYNQAAQKHVTTFLNDIQFTINSFSLKLNFYEEISKILFVGKGGQVKGLADFAGILLKAPCELFSCDKLFKTKRFKNKTKKIVNNWAIKTVALGTATLYDPHDQFNFRKKDFTKTYFPLLNKQLVVGVILVLSIFITIGVRGFFQIRNLQSIVRKRERQAITKLKKVFPPLHPSLKKKKLRALFRDAQNTIKEKNENWEPFLQENLQPLQILKDLTQTMNKKMFNIKVDKISIALDNRGSPEVELSGLFASQPGKHFTDFGNFVKYFEKQSAMLALKEDPVPEEEIDKGVKFIFKLKKKEIKSGDETS